MQDQAGSGRDRIFAPLLARALGSETESQVIRGSWDLAKLLDRADDRAGPAAMGGIDGDNDADARDNINTGYVAASKMAQSVNTSINSHMFWASIKLVNCLNTVLTHMSNWCSSCPCHSIAKREVP